MKSGVIQDYQPPDDYWKRVWTPNEGTKPAFGLPLSVDFEELAERYHLPNGLLMQRLVWNRGFVTPQDWLRAGIHDALVQALLSYGYGDKQACKRVADEIIREVRKDVE